MKTLLIATSIAGLALVGCGDDDDDAGSGAPDETTETSESNESSNGSEAAGPAQGDTTVDIVDFAYDPETIKITAGSTITFVNSDSADHTASEAGSGATFGTGTIEGGAQASLTFDTAGEFSYFCAFHPFMEGTIIVE